VHSAAIREVAEELGVKVAGNHLHFVGVAQRLCGDGKTYFDFYFLTRTWEGTAANNEPSKAEGLYWLSLAESREKQLVPGALEMLQVLESGSSELVVLKSVPDKV
jgi:8-oxo-dGTP pyrophosphatase MutT (NUDIX family)